MIRLGRVDYINTFPVAWSLTRHLPEGLATEVVGVPTRLNAMLHAGDVDVANVSSVEYGRHADEYVLLPSLCVGSDGAVESVQLVTDVPLQAVRSIAATSQSASSVALARVLFPAAEILGEDAAADARLLIGDQALRSAFEDPTPHHDLGALWRERTGMPMVFAVWAARIGTERLDELDLALAGAVAESARNAADVARAAAARFDYPAGFLARYFEKLRYRFGDRERAGLARFFQLAHAAGVIESTPDLRFASDLTGVN
jgi:chorismate dehydratase